MILGIIAKQEMEENPMKKIVSLALVLMMVVAMFAGCAASETPETTAKKTDQELLVGTWKGEMDMIEAIMEEAGEALAGLELDEFKVTAVFTFNEDGTYTMSLDEASVEAAFDGMIDSLEGIMKEMMEGMAQEAGMSLDDLLAVSGMTMEDLMAVVKETLEEEDLVGEMVKEAKTDGKYKAENGKLFTTTEADAEFDEEVYDTYNLDGDVLTLTNTFGADEADMLRSVYPIILKKAA